MQPKSIQIEAIVQLVAEMVYYKPNDSYKNIILFINRWTLLFPPK